MRYFKYEIKESNIVLLESITSEDYDALSWIEKLGYTNETELSKIKPSRILNLADEKDLS